MVDLPDVKPAQHFEHVIQIDRRQPTITTKQEAFQLMDQLDGWCSKHKASILIDLVNSQLKNKPTNKTIKIVEIGVYGGKSLVPMAYALKKADPNGIAHVYGIDPWANEESLQGVSNESNRAYWAWIDHSAIMNKLIYHINLFNLNDQIKLIRQSSKEATPIEEIDILHIDGNHSDEASYQDVTKWAPLVAKGGWIILDDITWHEENKFTQTRSIEWLNNHCLKMAEFRDEINVWGIWAKL